MITQTVDSAVQFQFTGTSLSWYGIYPKELPIQSTLATYSIDSGEENTFQLYGLTPNAPTAYNQLLFQTEVYSYGLHILNVTFQGGNTTTPLSLNHILLQTSDQTNGTEATPSTPVNEVSASRPSISVAGLVCGVVALFIIMAVLLVYYFTIEKRKQPKTAASSSSPANFTNPTRPSPTARHSTASAPRFDLASSSPYLEGTIVKDPSRHSTWHEKIRTSFSAAFNRTPHLGMVIANASTTTTTDNRKQQQQQQRPPQILSLWTRRNLSKQSHQRLADVVNVPHRHRPRMPAAHPQPAEVHHQAVPMGGEYLTGQLEEPRSAVDDDDDGHSGGNVTAPSLSLPSVSAGGLERSASSADASYYGGYRTKREMIELERRNKRP